MIALLLLSLPAFADVPVDVSADAAPDVVLDVDLECGSATVRGAATSTVHVAGTVKPDLDALEIRGSGKRVSIKLDGQRDHCAWLTIDLPAGASLRGDGVSASFDVEGITGNLHVESVSGAVTLRGASGEVEVATVSGAIAVSGAPPRVEAESVSGAIRIEAGDVRDIKAETVSSDVSIVARQVAEVTAASVSGDVRVEARLGREASLGTVSGDLTVHVPADQGMTLSASSFSGKVSGPLGGGKSGVIGDGAARVEVESFSGDIEVEAK